MGGSGPYREAGTTLASAILSARDIHNHLVPLALSRGARVVVARRSLLVVSRRETARRGKRKERKTSRVFGLLSLLSASDSLDFLLLPPIRLFDAIGNFRNFAGPFRTRDAPRGNEVPFVLTSRSNLGAGNKSRPDFVSFRTSPLRLAEPFVDRASSV